MPRQSRGIFMLEYNPMQFVSRVVIIALALLLAEFLVPGISTQGWVPLIVAAVALGVANAVIRPILVLVTLPLSVITFGLFLLIINGFLFWMVGQYIEGFVVADFWSAVLGAVIVSIVSSAANKA
jgi:putative membrane protein